MAYDPAAHDRYYSGLSAGPGFFIGALLLAVALVGLLLESTRFEEPQVTYTCNPEQPHLSVKECVR